MMGRRALANDENKLHQDSAEELGVLDGVINYADRMIYEEGKRSEYGPLRRHAYGKTVVIETELQGILTFRLSSTPAVYPNAASGYATPHSPVGRLCSFLRPGDSDETPRWGGYQVREVRLFDRYDGAEFEPNVRNFLSMKVEGEGAKARVCDLRGTLARAASVVAKQTASPVKGMSVETLGVDTLSTVPDVPVSAQPPSPLVSIDTLAVIDDEEPVAEVELDEDDGGSVVAVRATEDYYGLSETFFVNRTREQDEVMSRSPIGPMFVQGVAGSGKTSAALGRTKMLCDFNANGVSEEAEFREIAGHDLAYWSGRFAGQFSQEGSVGFVRTGELIQYLKETCRRLDLPHLPVQEYPELRSRLKVHRRIDRPRPGRPRWAGLPEPRGSFQDTTMEWLKKADQALAAYWAKALQLAVPDEDALVRHFEQGVREKALRVARVAVARLREQLRVLASELASPGDSGFALDRLATRVSVCVEQVRKEILGKDVLWVAMDGRSWVSRNEQEMAQALIQANAALHLKTGARLVFCDDRGPLDASLQLLSRTGEPLTWSSEARISLDKGDVVVRDAKGLTVPARASSAADLYLRLLPEAVEKIYAVRDGALRPLSVQRGLGKERLELLPTAANGLDDEPGVDEAERGAEPAEDAQKRRSVDAQFNTEARRALLQPLAHLADAYADALSENVASFPRPELARQIALQLQARKLTDADIDLLLCLAHVVGRGFAGTPLPLSEPPFFQAVFVDEVQDFTEQQVFLMAQQARPEYRAVTAVGDIAQKLHNGSTIDVTACFPEEALPIVQLTENLRQLEAPGLAWFSACYRAMLQDGLSGQRPTGALAERLAEHADRLHGPELLMVEDDAELVEQITEILALVPPRQTAAVLLPDAASAAACHAQCKAALAARMVDAELSEKIDLSRRHVRHFTAVANAKGLEFDVVLVPGLEGYRLDDGTHVNRLYVALTRARRKLVLLSHVDRPQSVFDDVWERYEAGFVGG
jgi:hypothetical protein